MQKHSELPWAINGVQIIDTPKDCDFGPSVVAEVTYHTAIPWEANAALIVRAVNCHDYLVAALEESLKEMAIAANRLHNGVVGLDARVVAENLSSVAVKARAALAKAKA